MSSPRAYSNQALYLAKIVLESWRARLKEQGLPATTLDLAFQPAVCSHLMQCYGWFLLELAGIEGVVDGSLPASVKQMPPVAEGKAQSGELRELARLEETGFIAQLQHAVASQGASAGPAGRDDAVLQTRSVEGPDIEDVTRWVQSFDEICDRMRNSLDEY